MSTIKDQYYSDPKRRPPRPEFHANTIPEELRAMTRWVAWKFHWKDDENRWTKVPLNPNEGCRKWAKSNDPATWSDFEKTRDSARHRAKCAPSQCDGLGFVFHGDGIFGLDIDGCRNPETGELTELAAQIVKEFGTYAEVSPSGMGIKLFGRGSLLWRKGRKVKLSDGQELELYDRGRYFTVTGQIVPDSAPTLSDCGDALAAIVAKHFTIESDKRGPVKTTGQGNTPSLDDREIIDRICKKHAALWNGSTDGHGGDDSAADLALCNLIAFFAGQSADVNRIDAIFRQSGLMRDKWNRSDYSGATIGKALEGRTEFYGSGKSRPIASAKPISDPLQGEIFKDTDLANARRFVNDHGNDVLFVADWNRWCVWDGMRWAVDPSSSLVSRMAHDTLRRMADAAAEKIFAALKAIAAGAASDEKEQSKAEKEKAAAEHEFQWAKKSQDEKRVRALLKMSQPYVLVQKGCEVFDTHPELLNCPNGTVNLKTGALQPHSQQDYNTKLCPTPFDPKATAPTYMAFLDSVLPDQSVAGYVREVSGYGVTGEVSDQSIHFFHGGGGNGKGVLLDTWLDVLGEYAVTAPSELIADHGESRHPTEKTVLRGAHLAICQETADDERLNEKRVKLLTGGSEIKARGMKQDFF
ncbi:MAG TPA: phage/plasmid primase, P4 family, partial [Urbifossiella sp.]